MKILERIELVSTVPVGPAQALFFRVWEYLVHASMYRKQGIQRATVFNHPPGSPSSLRRLSLRPLQNIYATGRPGQTFYTCTRCWQTWERFWGSARGSRDSLSESLIGMEQHDSVGAAHYKVFLIGPTGLSQHEIAGSRSHVLRPELERMKGIFESFRNLCGWWDVVTYVYNTASDYTTRFHIGDVS